MRKILFASTLMVICFFIFLFVGLNKKNNISEHVKNIPKITNETLPSIVAPDESAENHTNSKQKTPLFSSDGTFKSIYDSLARNKSVFEISWAPNNQYVTFAKGNSDDWWGYSYFWKVGEKEPIQLNVPEERVSDFYWSPNSEYVLLDVGTSPLRGGFLITIVNLAVSETFSYMTAVFSPDSKYLALGTPNEHIKHEEFSPDDAFDLSIYNNETNEMQVISETDEEHNFFPIEWINRETIRYKKVHVFNREEKELTIKLNLAVKDLEVLTYGEEERKKVHINLPTEMKAYKVEKDILPYYTITNRVDEYIGEFGTVRQGSEILEATLHVPWDELIKSEKVQTKLGEGTLNWLTVRENSQNKENEVNSPYLIYVHVPDGNDHTGQYYSHHLIVEVEKRSDFEKLVPLIKEIIEP